MLTNLQNHWFHAWCRSTTNKGSWYLLTCQSMPKCLLTVSNQVKRSPSLRNMLLVCWKSIHRPGTVTIWNTHVARDVKTGCNIASKKHLFFSAPNMITLCYEAGVQKRVKMALKVASWNLHRKAVVKPSLPTNFNACLQHVSQHAPRALQYFSKTNCPSCNKSSLMHRVRFLLFIQASQTQPFSH